MKTFSILSAVCLVILGSTWATAQTNRGNPRDGQAANHWHFTPVYA